MTMRKGIPKQIYDEIYKAVYGVLRNRHHTWMSMDYVAGVSHCAVDDAIAQWKRDHIALSKGKCIPSILNEDRNSTESGLRDIIDAVADGVIREYRSRKAVEIKSTPHCLMPQMDMHPYIETMQGGESAQGKGKG
jgi:hypothetical protein